MNTRHHTYTSVPARSRSTDRCLRHHVWMAACADCRAAHAPLLRRAENRTIPQR